jgi:hypothetical protein
MVLKEASQVIINGLFGKRIILKRGVRQDDTLSPFFLFLLWISCLNGYTSSGIQVL